MSERTQLIRKKEFTVADFNKRALLVVPTNTRSTKPDEPGLGAADDDLLWAYVKAGNELGFLTLYRRYVNRLYNYGMHGCEDCEIVKHSLEEVFVHLWSKQATLSGTMSVRHYLFKFFRRLLIKRLISNGKLSRTFQNGPSTRFEFFSPKEDSIIDGKVKNQQLEISKAGVKGITTSQREAIFLKFFNELSSYEVSSIMELPEDSVCKLISTALDSLRTKLQ